MRQEELDQILEEHQKWLKTESKEGTQANFSNDIVDDNYNHDPQSMRVIIEKEGRLTATGGTLYIDGVECEDALPSHFTKLDFRSSDLRGAIFDGALFYECDMSNVNLAGCCLSTAKFAKVDLKGANLGGMFEPLAMLKGVIFSHCDLSKLFLQRADFEGSDISMSNFYDSKFYNCSFNNTTAKGVNFNSSSLWNSSFRNCTLVETTFNDAKLDGCDLSFSNLRLASFENANVYNVTHDIDGLWKRVKEAFKGQITPKHIGCRCSSAYGNERFKKRIKEEAYVEEFARDNSKLYKAWLLSSDCGRSMGLWLVLSGFIILLFSTFFYLGSDSFTFNLQVQELVDNKQYFPFVYYSVVTFKTLGFGDITPITQTAMFLVVCEVIIGFIMLGLLISILANKVASRS